MIDIGAHRLHIQCVGQGQPTIVLEAGLGGTSLEWSIVQNRLAQFNRVCSYDRAGVGWSEPGPNPRTSDQITEELHTLLQLSAEKSPYLLVGHSFGGYTVQLFASRFPELTAALVLIDSSHPEQILRFAAPPVNVNIAPKGRLMTLAPVGVPGNIPAEVRETASALIMTHQSRIAVTRELEGFRYSARQLIKAAPLPDIPLIVLTRGLQKWPNDERGNRMEALWQQLQTELVHKTANAAQIIALDSGHHIHLDQPELVIDAILLAARVYQALTGAATRKVMRMALQETARRFYGHAMVTSDLLRQPMMAMDSP
jgi:pimeloyl-ACP methyl ester carboxylesterase